MHDRMKWNVREIKESKISPEFLDKATRSIMMSPSEMGKNSVVIRGRLETRNAVLGMLNLKYN